MAQKRSREEVDAKKGWKPYFPEATGPLDVPKLDLPSDHSPLEWWYFNTHLTGKKTGNDLSVFSSFFRQAEADSRTAAEAKQGKPFKKFLAACTWAVSNITDKHYYPDNLLDPSATETIIKRLDPKISGKKPMHAEVPILELARKGKLPRPDRMMKKTPEISNTKLHISLDEECTLDKVAAAHSQPANAVQGSYKIHLHNPRKNITVDLTLTPQVAAVRHGASGVVNHMFYYYIPRCTVTGTVDINGEKEEVEGSGWYDREFGGSEDLHGTDALDAWTWFSVQLSDNTEFSFFNVVDRDTQSHKELVGVLTSRDGERRVAHDCTLTYSDMWTSLNTYIEYPMQWKLSVPSLNLELTLTCAFAHQEFLTVIVQGGGFYEGRIFAQGASNGKAVEGRGFLERKNHTNYTETKGLLKNVGRFVRKVLGEMYPLDASQDYIDKVVLGRHCTGRGVPPKVVCDTLFKPVRALIDRGGKAWRSLVLVSSINALAPDHIDCSKYIAISELLHVGSLIIDDIQDESSIRRGGKCVHVEFGIPTAINAGTGCYFMAPILSDLHVMEPKKGHRLYNLYFDVMRAGHAGQGLDIKGLHYLMPEVVETGVTDPVFDALRAIHTYKTGGAAGTLCEMACVICDVPDEITDAMAHFGAQLGLAFQIVDDALNLKGFEGDLKEVGEDIRDGKITYPVIKGMGRLNKTDRKYIWSILEEHTEDTGKISSVIAKLNGVGAIDECLEEAHNLVEEAWTRLDPHLEDSLPKMMMRVFCNYLTERTI